MKKILFLLLFISSTLQAETFSGYYVSNEKDTVICIFTLQKKHKDLYDFSAVTKKVILTDHEGIKTFKPKDIVCFAIEIPDDKIYKFVSIKEDNKSFFQEIISGKISLYKVYSKNSYDSSLSIIPIAYKYNKLVYLNVANRKKRISDLFMDNSIVLEKWKATKSNAWTGSWFDTTEIEKYIREYNELDISEE